MRDYLQEMLFYLHGFCSYRSTGFFFFCRRYAILLFILYTSTLFWNIKLQWKQFLIIIKRSAQNFTTLFEAATKMTYNYKKQQLILKHWGRHQMFSEGGCLFMAFLHSNCTSPWLLLLTTKAFSDSTMFHSLFLWLM